MKLLMSVLFLLVWSTTPWACAAARPPQPSAQSSFDELLRTIRTGNAYQRVQAIGPLSQIEDPRVVPELAALLIDEDATVRVSVARELARLADRRSADALTRPGGWDPSQEDGR